MEDATPITFLDGTYREALALTREARDYVALQERLDRAGLEPELQLVESCESLRVTARLTQVMAWLLLQRAVHAGEVEPEAARAPEHRLGAREICSATAAREQVALPQRLRELLARSGELYQRVARLDASLDRA